MGYNQAEPANIIVLKIRVSKMLNKKWKLPLNMIRQLH